MWTLVNIKLNSPIWKKCAFCKYWYDPTNACIRPRFPRTGTWQYDQSARNMCTKKGIERPAFTSCRDFTSKMDQYK